MASRRQARVVAHVPDPEDHASGHERSALLLFARRLAALRGDAAGGFYDPLRDAGHPLYFVPSSTLTAQQASALRITGPQDLFGGVVPHAFVGTKAISHPLVAPGAVAPPGWSDAFAQRVQGAVLAGYTVFDAADARLAGQRLLQRGPVRLKPVRATGGQGQQVLQDAEGLQRALAALDAADLAHGLVLEEDLQELRTISVGQVRVAELVATYHGVQRLTRNNAGAEVFGGSTLDVVRGDFDALLAHPLPPEIRHAVAQAQQYHAAVHACFPGFYASRSNYDILLGRDAQGTLRSAVLEQSWRLGGASGPEIAALEAFRADPGRQRVRAACFEVFGAGFAPPDHATVYFLGDDPAVGPLAKYTVYLPHDDPSQPDPHSR